MSCFGCLYVFLLLFLFPEVRINVEGRRAVNRLRTCRLMVGKLSSRMAGGGTGTLLLWEFTGCCFLAEDAKYPLDVVK